MKRATFQEQRILYPPLQSAFESFLTDCHIRRLSPPTIEFYKDKLLRFITYCEAQAVTSIEQVDAEVLRRFFLWLEERGNNPGGRHAYFRVLRAAFLWLENEWEGYTSPLRKLKPPKVDIQPIEGISIEDFQALLATCQNGSFVDVRDKALLLTLMDTGLRIGECLKLQWSDIDLVTGQILVRKGKNGKPRMAFVGRTTRQALRQYARIQQRNAYVWVTQQGERVSYSTVRDLLLKRSVKAGLKTVPSPHDFRRGCALNLLRNGADVVSVSRLLGHSSLEMTKRYLAQTEADLQQAHQRFSPVENMKNKK